MKETELERWDRAKTLMLESLYKPDNKLRGCAYNQGCKDYLMEIRDEVIEMVEICLIHMEKHCRLVRKIIM